LRPGRHGWRHSGLRLGTAWLPLMGRLAARPGVNKEYSVLSTESESESEHRDPGPVRRSQWMPPVGVTRAAARAAPLTDSELPRRRQPAAALPVGLAGGLSPQTPSPTVAPTA
jgi:hypothetical protein